MRLAAGGATDRGPRSINQDAFFIDVALGLFVVADGMGGHRAGEVASRMAVDAIVEFIRVTAEGSEITWPFPFDPEQSVAVNRLTAALRLANRAVYDAGETTSEYAGMGTTVVALLIHDGRIVIGHVGDSRAYVWRGGELMQMTHDHTLVNAIGGDVSPDHPLRHVLINSIGSGPELRPAVAEVALVTGERWLMCTDGVHGYVATNDLRSALALPVPQAAAHDAVLRALQAGGVDNATAVVMNVE